MSKRIIEAIRWRVGHASDRAKRVRWHARRLADVGTKVDRAPTIALVVIGRNDNYGGDVRGRLDATLTWNLQYPFHEAIYVEWNPLPERPSDADWLVKKFPNLRVYRVSAERHQRYCTNPKMQMLEYFAKNVGMRRATSDWICQ